MKNIYQKLYEIQEMNLSFKKESDNPYFKSKYLNLEDLVKTIKPVLKEKKLLVVHYGKDNSITTRIVDTESEDYVESQFPIQQGIDPQKVGSAITYGKRYNLGQLLNIITDEDDDGNATSTVKPKVSIYEQSMNRVKGLKTKKELEEAKKKIEEADIYEDDEKFELISEINERVSKL